MAESELKRAIDVDNEKVKVDLLKNYIDWIKIKNPATASNFGVYRRDKSGQSEMS